MKLDTKAIRYLTVEDWRVLTAVEMGSRNHEVVPTPLIQQISNLRGGSGVHKCISTLAKANLIAKVKNAKYDGYRLTYGGIDYLALNAHRKSSTVYSVGNQIGVGKESDIYVVASDSGLQRVLKIHRLGRISFRTVKTNRDYLRNRSSGSWMYMSRLAALKEFTFMQVLRDNGIPTPEPIAQNRHTIVMSLIDAFPLRQISSVPDPASLYAELLELIVRLASFGLIHGDFNEFNILVKEDAAPSSSLNSDEPPTITLTPIVIDFPQMISISHPDAEYYFDRDVNCIKRFFERRFHFTSDESGPFFKDATSNVTKRLDVEAEASGFSKKMARELEKYMKEVGVDGDGGVSGEGAKQAEDRASIGAEDDDDDECDAPQSVGDGKDVADQPRLPDATLFPGNADPTIPDADLNATFTVLDIKDFDQGGGPMGVGLEAAPSVAPTTRTISKKAAGWAI
ncbi:RIO1-domain-containing protein [Pseudovirgaria hyperparasitica]|uniref:Serine/threonine-protein kinase RIO2 n=1 Tax=Pseudovirgaria hyperparasitica TaxID=470096 RepID=A0A6A6W015_9PEZI|nr:RIO1-domain-containing protein [Pseudovirgaria hyperparasitica]KAF2755324.1 RIO1-domain-containing protein [Pseudovirgaria hyperparasitica]